MWSIGLLPYDEEWWHFYDPAIVWAQALDRESV
jgi:D-alanyl-D-alanine dipeptidase